MSTVPDGGVVVVARPPLVYLVSILLGLVVNLVWPWEPFPRGVSPVGMVLTLLAVTLFVPAVREFRAAQTPIRTRKPVTAVLTSGPYRLSRNPIYSRSRCCSSASDCGHPLHPATPLCRRSASTIGALAAWWVTHAAGSARFLRALEQPEDAVQEQALVRRRAER